MLCLNQVQLSEQQNHSLILERENAYEMKKGLLKQNRPSFSGKHSVDLHLDSEPMEYLQENP